MMGLSDELKCLKQLKPWGDEEEEREPSQKDKPLHDMYHQQIEEVTDIEKSYQWLQKAGLKDSTEALTMAAREQALSTRAIEVTSDKTPGVGCPKKLLRLSST